MFFWDSTFILVIIGAMIAGWAQMKVSSTFNRYSQVRSEAGVPAWQVARNILDTNGLSDVAIERISGNLTDHYDPRSKVLRLSQTVYDSPSVAAIGVAAHEVGHAIQHDTGYMPLEMRNTLVPIANIGSSLSWVLIILGLLVAPGLLKVGCIAFSMIVLFQLVTLPVEFDASKRAKE
ncbi:MAG: zinc metallopeptidase, partial [Clostridiales bacterium]